MTRKSPQKSDRRPGALDRRSQQRLEWLADEVWRIAIGTEPAD